MMGFWRNPDIRRGMILSLLLWGIGVAGFGILGGWGQALAAFVTGLLLLMFHFGAAWRLYRKMAKMSEQLDRILHEGSTLKWEDYEEGELAILFTQIKKLVRQLGEQREQLEQDKIFLADSLADISHQIKTPSTSIHLLLDFLQEDEVAPERRKELARDIVTLLERIDWLIYALLKMSQLDAGVAKMRTDQISVPKMVQMAYEPLAVAMDLRDISWENRAGEGNASFCGDLSWSAEALGNILKNCMEHTPAGGSISVDALENAIYTQITVTDTGEGIAEEDMPHLFERFYRGKGSGSQSVGIGLSLSQRILRAQNGIIEVKNREGMGAVFILRIYKSVV